MTSRIQLIFNKSDSVLSRMHPKFQVLLHCVYIYIHLIHSSISDAGIVLFQCSQGVYLLSESRIAGVLLAHLDP
jgi:hypothetical protein